MRQLLRDNQPVITHETLTSCCDTFLAVGCEREVTDTRVSAIEGPFGFAVADDEATRGWHSVFLKWRFKQNGVVIRI